MFTQSIQGCWNVVGSGAGVGIKLEFHSEVNGLPNIRVIPGGTMLFIGEVTSQDGGTYRIVFTIRNNAGATIKTVFDNTLPFAPGETKTLYEIFDDRDPYFSTNKRGYYSAKLVATSTVPPGTSEQYIVNFVVESMSDEEFLRTNQLVTEVE